MCHRKFHLFYFLLFLSFNVGVLNAQRKIKQKTDSPQQLAIATTPKLVVGIVVDQMRYDYLSRFWHQYGDGGFKRMVQEGFNCKNNHFNYAPTYTGPGHASVYSGATPSSHGVIGNDWYDKESDKSVYCAGDPAYSSVGTASRAGEMSPHRMTSTTLTDQLRLHTQMRGKVIAISLKDRGAVLPGGHSANAAYWFHGENEGNWITSSYYMDELPKWVSDFNAARSVDKYKKPWTTLKDINTYTASGSDDNAYEGLFKGQTSPTFPHDLEAYWDKNGQYSILKGTPYGSNLTTDFALAAVKEEALGVDDIPDFLAVSYSSTDYVGHKYGVNSKEIEDTYVRLDLELERLFNSLDKTVGKGEYTVFLTSDHAGVHVPAYLQDKKLPGSYVDFGAVKKELNDYLKNTYDTSDLVRNFSNNQVFLNHEVVENLNLDLVAVQEAVAKHLLKNKEIQQVFTAHQLSQNEYTSGIPNIIQNGYNLKRSGDVILVLKPGSASYSRTGSTHGSPWKYDTHAPLLFFGKGIKNGSTVRRTEIPDIAPTISALLGIAFPFGATGEPIIEVVE
ncbi:Predicted pyrophosphatase or phosphodiesterase, AlkP superfamily [Arenibacter nanhaiticus]|uniref:Predicted pyrophosphatase or phosphodiesterase, AlkP superfamily n=1 Tax=Arenibacter nanhaiticus TaxID=558155 RepID=A0A1M6ERY2_9FLAO|nr:alkaline phosphatase PafA [Arenibacter nanhaiticus]SHI88254.1 Predicted pyrophosphatase or phosphodiesterase, AlkP superfamily [Arenibacter nanhaiticus]